MSLVNYGVGGWSDVSTEAISSKTFLPPLSPISASSSSVGQRPLPIISDNTPRLARGPTESAAADGLVEGRRQAAPGLAPNLAVFPAVGYTPIKEELGEGVGAAGDEQPGLSRGERRPRVTRHAERPHRAPAGAATAAAPCSAGRSRGAVANSRPRIPRHGRL
jgi:hypothetical protein